MAAYQTVTLTGTYQTPDGTPHKGHVEIIPSERVIKDTTGDVILTGRVKVDLDAQGAFSVVLPATDDPTLNPTGFGYTIAAKLHSSHPPAVSFSLPASLGATTVEDVTPVDPSTFAPTTTYAEKSELDAVAATIPSTAADIGALPDTTVIPTTPADLGAEPAGLSQGTSDTLANTYAHPPISGEPTVTDIKYPPGDLRRYGITPADTDATAQGNAIITVVNWCATNGHEVYVPPGYYVGGLNVNVSNARVRVAQGAEFGGIIHIGGNGAEQVTDIEVQGPLVTYDRFGVYKVDGFRFDTARCKSDGTKNTQTPGSRGRGAHIYNLAANVIGRAVIVDDMDQASVNAEAAIAIDGFQANPYNLNIGLLHVKKSDIHGVYITGRGHHIASIIVDEYGAGAYQGPGLQDATAAQSTQLKGVWTNRCNATRIDNIVVNQGTGTRTNATHDVLIDETSLGGTDTGATLFLGSIYAKNVAGSSRGVCIGDATSAPNYVISATIDTIKADVASGRASVAGYAAVNVAGGASVSIGAVRVFSPDLQTDAFQTESGTTTTVGSLTVGSFKARAAYLKGRAVIQSINGHRTGVVSSTAGIELSGTGAAFTHLGAIEITTSAAHAARCLWINGTPDVTVTKFHPGPHATGGGTLTLSPGGNRFTCRDFNITGSGTAGTGIVISSCTDLLFERGTVTGHGTGVSTAGTIGGSAVGVQVTGNTTNTTAPNGSFQMLGCTGLTL